MSKSGGLPPRSAPPDGCATIQAALRWRPRTLLEYLLVVALLGILVAVTLIIGVELHLVHRLT